MTVVTNYYTGGVCECGGRMIGYERGPERCEACGAERPTHNMPCLVYSRIVGYMAPVGQWNRGKRQEFRERRTFEGAVNGAQAKG